MNNDDDDTKDVSKYLLTNKALDDDDDDDDDDDVEFNGHRHVAVTSLVLTILHDDDNETAEDYRDFLTRALKRNLPMLCANPDIVVERGNRLIDCAGAIAKLYEEAGGTTLYAGKPHPPIYKAALELASSFTGKAPNAARTLAIGDAIRTDIAGAVTSGFGSLFIMNGIHMHELGLSEGRFESDRFDAFLAKVSHKPDFSIAHLAW